MVFQDGGDAEADEALRCGRPKQHNQPGEQATAADANDSAFSMLALSVSTAHGVTVRA
jgi:hypothetical protein